MFSFMFSCQCANVSLGVLLRILTHFLNFMALFLFSAKYMMMVVVVVVVLPMRRFSDIR